MLFGRVQGIAEPIAEDDSMTRIVVWLETSSGMRAIRDEVLPVLHEPGVASDLSWSADQYAQETIATTLAEEGWEVIGGGDRPDTETGEVARSAAYAVRRL